MSLAASREGLRALALAAAAAAVGVAYLLLAKDHQLAGRSLLSPAAQLGAAHARQFLEARSGIASVPENGCD